MKLMNLFNRKSKVPTALPPTPIQDENGNLTFILNTSESTTRDKDVCSNIEGKIYSLNVNSEEERERVKEEVNANSLAKYDWFKETTGKEHWVLYNTEMYEYIKIVDEYVAIRDHLQYRENSALAPVLPINATSCYYMFSKCNNLTKLNLSNFNTGNITNMCGMFSECYFLIKLDVSNFDTSKVINMSYMFDNCSSLTQLDLRSFDTSKVTNMDCMFNRCESLTQLDLSNFDTSRVAEMYAMFWRCKSLTQLNLSNFDTSSVIKMIGMFRDCSALAQLDLSNFDTSHVLI